MSSDVMLSLTRVALVLSILAPMLSAVAVGVLTFAREHPVSERTVSRLVGTGLATSVLACVTVLLGALGWFGAPVRGDIAFGDWLRIGDFSIPAMLLVDPISVTIALFASVLTALVARFSRTYLHKERGYVRFFALLGVFATGTQLVAFSGALELFFAGWELLGLSSAFFIGFFHERAEPVRSSIRAFAIYRLSDEN